MSLENINIIIAVKSRVEHPPFFYLPSVFKLHFYKKKEKQEIKKTGGHKKRGRVIFKSEVFIVNLNNQFRTSKCILKKTKIG
jgi:hypothetical protein